MMASGVEAQRPGPGMNAVIKSVEDTAASDVRQYLEALLSEAQGGEIVGLTVVLEYKGGSYCVGGPRVMSRLQTAGALLEAAVKRLDL